MFDNKFIFTLVGLIMAVLAICKFNIGNTENFVPRQSVVMDMRTGSQQAKDMQNTYFSNSVDGMKRSFVGCSNYQAAPPPRLCGAGFGGILKENMAPKAMQGLDASQPLSNGCQASYDTRKQTSAEDFANTVENFSVQDAQPVMPTYGPEYENTNLPVDDMTANGQPIIYDRLIFANKQVRTRSQGDPIRGDLPIVPNRGDWFQVSAQPQTMLQQGAMNVMAGPSEAGNAMNELIHNVSAGTDATIGGVNVAGSVEITEGPAYQDISASAFI